jgi:hypothetical protein
MLIHNAAITGSLTYNGIDISDITSSEASVASLNSFSSSILSYTASNNTNINALQTFSSSILTYTASNDSINTTQNNRLSSLETTSGSLINASSSFSTRVSSLESFSSSLDSTFATDAELTSLSSSVAGRLTTDENTITNNSSSFASRLTTDENNISSLQTASGSFSTRTTNLETASGSFSTRVTSNESNITSLNSKTGSYATTESNTFVNTQYISAANNSFSFTSTASLYTDGGVRVSKDLYVSGTSYFNNVTIYGTQSVQYITSSQLNIGTNIINVNTDTPSIRFGGLSVYDSGSTGLTGSMLWDSQDNQWIYSNPSGSEYDSAVFLVGPRNSGVLGNEPGISCNFLSKGNGLHHMTSSGIFEDGSRTCFYGNSFISSSGAACFGGTTTIGGNLNVGNTSTTSSITITGTSVGGFTAGYIGWGKGSQTTAGLYIESPGTNLEVVTGYNERVALSTGTGLQVYTNDGIGNYSSRMLLDRSGNVCFFNNVCAPVFGFTAAANSCIWADASYTRFVTSNSERLSIDVSGIACFKCQVCAPMILPGCLGVGTSTTSNFRINVAGHYSGETTSWPTDSSSDCYRSGIGWQATTNSSVVLSTLITTINEGNYGGNIVFLNRGTSGGNLNERFRITAGGIACFSSTVCAPRLEILRSSANNGLFLYSNSGATAIGCTMAQINGLTNDSTGNILTLASLNDGIRMVVRNDGAVGIGTTSLKSYASLTSAGQIIALSNIGIDTAQSFRLNNYYNSGTVTDRTISNGYAAAIGLDNSVGAMIFATSATCVAADNNVTVSERMRITNCGNIGINFPTPSFPLTRSGMTMKAATNDGTEFVMLSCADTGFLGGALVRNGVDFGVVNRTNGNLIFATNAQERLYITGAGIACFACQVCAPVAIFSGCVGINETSPLSMLHFSRQTIWGTSDNRVININNTGTGGDINQPHNMGSITWYSGNSTPTAEIAAYRNTPASGNNIELRFYTAAAGTPFERMRITSTGCVGIGTTSPNTILHTTIQTCWATNGTVLNSYPVATFSQCDCSGGARGLQIGVPTGGVSSPVFLKVSNTGARFAILNDSNCEDLTISGGRVGIRSCSPNATLHVGGNSGDIAMFICSTCKTSNPTFLRLIGVNSDDATAQFQIVHRGNHSNSGFTDRIDFSVNNGTSWCERVIRLDFNGNVAMCEGNLSVASCIARKGYDYHTVGQWYKIPFYMEKGNASGTPRTFCLITIDNNDGFQELHFTIEYGSRLQGVSDAVTQTSLRTYGVNRFVSNTISVTDSNFITGGSGCAINTHAPMTVATVGNCMTVVKVDFSSSVGGSSFVWGEVRIWSIEPLAGKITLANNLY